jgi:hypothetical protein
MAFMAFAVDSASTPTHCKFLSYVTRTMKQAIFRDQFVEFAVVEQNPALW